MVTFKKTLIAAGFLLAAGTASASAGLMIGVSYDFKDSVGFTLKALSSNEENKAVAAAGVEYFPWSNNQKWGLDLGVGYVFVNSAAVISYDFLQKPEHAAQFSAGYVNTMDDDDNFIYIPGSTPIILPPPPPGGPV